MIFAYEAEDFAFESRATFNFFIAKTFHALIQIYRLSTAAWRTLSPCTACYSRKNYFWTVRRLFLMHRPCRHRSRTDWLNRNIFS